jgi:trimeric autotransporter adhesin
MELASTRETRGGVTAAIPLVLLLSLTLATFGCGGSPSAATAPPATTKTLTSISISPAGPTIALGQSQQLTATGTFSDHSKQDVTKTVAWASTEPSVASVSQSGLALGKLVGSTALTATSGAVTASDSLTVGPAVIVSIAVSPTGFSIPKGATQQLIALATLSDGSQKNIADSATWSAVPNGIAVVNTSGLITGQAVGSATVTAGSASVSGSANLTVSPAVPVSIAVSPRSPSVPKGTTQQLDAVATFTDGSQKSMTDSATWSIVPTGIATVSTTGLVTGDELGSATITASMASIRGSDLLTVSPAILVSIAVAPANSSIMLGTTEQFTATGTFSDGSIQDLTNSAAWSSANTKVGISPAGVATALNVGSTTISATSDDVSGSATLTVEPQLLVTYFSHANNSATNLDATVYVTNVGMTNSSLCAMVYVFDTQQEMTECCACSASPDDLRTLSINHDLTNEPATGTVPSAGVIEIVSAGISNQICNASSSSPGGELSAWSTHIQVIGTSTFALTETPFEVVPLTATHASLLQSQCGFLMTETRGICTCGAGD